MEKIVKIVKDFFVVYCTSFKNQVGGVKIKEIKI